MVKRFGNVIMFPHGRRGLAGPVAQEDMISDFLAIANYLEGAAKDTPYKLWVKSLAGEIRRLARQMK